LAVFGDEFSTNIAFMDNATKKFIFELNKLSDAMKNGEGRQYVVFALDFLGDYAENHLLSEEKVMIKYRFHDIEGHSVQHDEFRAELLKVTEEYAAKGADHSFPLMVQRMMASWLSRHISRSDKVLGDFFAAAAARAKS
jgi:hemerythrin